MKYVFNFCDFCIGNLCDLCTILCDFCIFPTEQAVVRRNAPSLIFQNYGPCNVSHVRARLGTQQLSVHTRSRFDQIDCLTLLQLRRKKPRERND